MVGGALGVWPPERFIRQTARALAALLPAGAYDAAPLELESGLMKWVTFSVTYIQGAVNGAVDLMIETSPYNAVGEVPAGAQEWFTSTLYVAGAPPPAPVGSDIYEEFITFTSTAAANAITYGPIRLGGTIPRLRVSCRESGVELTPGTCHIVAYFAPYGA